MGEFFDLQEAGLLDEMGEYIGDDPGYHAANSAAPRNQQIRNFMKQRGITTPKAQKRAIKEYGIDMCTSRPTFHAYHNWKVFKDFINKRVGYVAPNKKSNHAS